MDFYGGCMFCDKAVECQIAGKPADDCPVEAIIKAKDDLKKDMMETKFFKAMERIADRLEAIIESFH
jgi:hypothetical protein